MNKESNSYITVAPGSHYHNAAYNSAYCKSSQYLVIDFFAWTKWYNAARFQRNPEVPPPSFVGDTYEIALRVKTELNDSIEALSQ